MTALTIRPLTPELAADYFDFFEHRAFTDDAPWRCYCQGWHEKKGASYEGVPEEELGRMARAEAEEQIASGILRGYLAYLGGKAVGWCCADDRANFPPDSSCGEHLHAPAEAREMAVVCFEIAPEYRGQGMATALLARVLEDAAKTGYRAVVAWPVRHEKRFEWDFTGPVRLYEHAGFAPCGTAGGCVVMRKEL